MKENKKISGDPHSVNILPKLRQKSAPPMEGRHEKFQFGNNPMKMSDFERSRIMLEAEERKLARHKYIKGIQGRDGGCFEHERKNETDYSI